MNNISIQFDEHSCALSSLRTLAYLITKKRGWKNIAFSSHPPYSLKVLEQEMGEYGFSLEFYHSEKEKFSYPFDKEEPFLVLLKEGDGTHMAVVTSIDKDNVTYIDPASDKKKVTREYFLSLWTGIWGVMEQEFEISPPKRKRIVPLWREIVSNSLLFFAEVTLGLGFAFLDKTPLWLTILCLSLSILLEEIRRLFIINSIRWFDKKYLNEIYDDNPDKMKRNYERFNALKKNIFSDVSSVVTKIGSAIFIAVIIGMNTPSFFLSIGGVLVLLLGEKYIFNRYFHAKRDRMQKEEGLLYRGGEESEKIQLLFSLSKEADHYGKMMFLEKAIIAVTIGAFSLLPSIMSNDSSLNFYLFHLFTLMLVEKYADDVFEYALDRREREINILYFHEYFAKGK